MKSSAYEAKTRDIILESQTTLAERDSMIANLRLLLDRCNEELDGLEQSVTTSL
jgi:hypothetical protein